METDHVPIFQGSNFLAILMVIAGIFLLLCGLSAGIVGSVAVIKN
jgi:hypothetical protein